MIQLPKRAKVCSSLIGALMLAAIAPFSSPLNAVQLSDGTTVFESPPRLVSFVTTRNRTYDRRATYYVTIDLLPEAGEPLKTLQVSLSQGRFTQLDYRLDDIEVFQGDRNQRGAAFPISSAEYDDDTQTLTIHLATAAEPGQTLTFALRPVRNPTREGVYLFNVMAAPEGDLPVFQRVGTGRLHIFRPDGRDPFDF
ncbi:MAG: DUF2808 domain-containing protein [Leptolyngbya sp. SIO1E4]|nr:DUF2808 domain-containing protein [Leptolyngbya sp. SIO1E4]